MCQVWRGILFGLVLGIECFSFTARAGDLPNPAISHKFIQIFFCKGALFSEPPPIWAISEQLPLPALPPTIQHPADIPLAELIPLKEQFLGAINNDSLNYKKESDENPPFAIGDQGPETSHTGEFGLDDLGDPHPLGP